MCWSWIGSLVVCATLTLTDAECHCYTTTACDVFPSTPCSQAGKPDICQEGWFGSYCQKQNIALRRPCTQSSTFEGGYAATEGVDGKTAFSPSTSTHTKQETNPHWTVNLDTSVPEKIQHIRLYLRVAIQDRNNGMEIRVGSQMCYNWSSTEHPPPIANVTCGQPLTGTTVTIRIPGALKYLTLCEVQIFVCSDGWFSEDCDKQCRCRNSNDVCDKITGHCSSGCLPGYHGTDCQTECPDGFYGINCASRCGSCLNSAVCSKTTGTCPGGCAVGWMSGTCLQACPDGSYGINCASRCGNCLNGVSCDKTTGTCSGGCAAGWVNDDTKLCLQQCPDGFYGINCASRCGNCLNSAFCSKTTGTCPGECAAGWMSDTCLQACPDGFYGINCASRCGNCLDGVGCDKTTGTCPGGCAAGWVNDVTKLCLQHCPNGSYGINCASKCGNCISGVSCDQTNGACPDGCAAGWMSNETTSCLQLPQYICSKCGNCLSGLSSDKKNGACADGCAAGWMSDDTTSCLQPCQNGSFMYGINCASQCGNCLNGVSCNKTTGTCPGGCAAGWMNDDTKLCQQRLSDGGSVAGIVGGAAAALCVIAAVVIFVICLKRRKRKDDDSKLSVPLKVRCTKAESKDEPLSRSSIHAPPAIEQGDAVFSVEAEVDGDNDVAATYYNWVPPHMRLDNLKRCIYENKKKASFETEYKMIPFGARHPHEAAIKLENKEKNRFLALFAYDDSRVVLADGEDYINANYIMGYGDTQMYIATQGPRPTTVTDFWRMVWQEDVTQIVMLTRLMEVNKKKCERYWPDGSNTEAYGGCKVTNKNVKARADYTVSTFLVEKLGSEKTVTHYHFTSWPDHGVPSAPALVNFWRLVKQGDMNRGPMVVHCSAGVGRTGAFLALDYLMDEAESNHINVFMCVDKMRQNRMNMVQTVKQYEFVHDVVLEALNSRGTLYTSSEFDRMFGVGETFTTSQVDMLKEQFELLQEQTSDLEEAVTSEALLPENSSKNRNQHVLPGNKSRPYLCTPVQGRNDFINAVFVSSTLRPSSMIVTQTPLPDTVVDFWRLVYDHDCFTIVCLDDSQEIAELYPEDSNTLQTGPFSVTHVDTVSNGSFFTVRNLTLVYDKENTGRSVTVFCLRSTDMMESSASLLELIDVVERIIISEDQKILIHCHDGAGVSGVFSSALNIVSRLRLDRDVDIFLTIRELQRVRPQFIQSFDQFKLCYDIVKECKRASNIYANL